MSFAIGLILGLLIGLAFSVQEKGKRKDLIAENSKLTEERDYWQKKFKILFALLVIKKRKRNSDG